MMTSTERCDAAVRRLLVLLVREPERAARLPPEELDLALRVARRARLLARLAAKLHGRPEWAELPAAAREQLSSALVLMQARARATTWELNRLAQALAQPPALRVVVLKGCAYLLAGLPNAAGRAFADVDLLFAESDLAEAERRLLANGWRGTKLEPYDQHYYRAWTHELPPLVHAEREVEADLHHSIVPRMGRLKPSSERLLESVRRVDRAALWRLDDTDLVLHAMTHLMFDSDLADSLRDLVDIDDLLRHFSSKAEFYELLWERARVLDLTKPAFYALRYAHAYLGTPVPPAVLERSREAAPPRFVVALMDALVPRALFPIHPDTRDRTATAARLFLYARSLWIRMPPVLLARHLLYKLYVRLWKQRRRSTRRGRERDEPPTGGAGG